MENRAPVTRQKVSFATELAEIYGSKSLRFVAVSVGKDTSYEYDDTSYAWLSRCPVPNSTTVATVAVWGLVSILRFDGPAKMLVCGLQHKSTEADSQTLMLQARIEGRRGIVLRLWAISPPKT